MRAVITSVFDTSAEKVWENAQYSKTMFYICDGMIAFRNHDIPETFATGIEAQCRLWFFNIFPGWKHHWRINHIDHNRRIIDSAEYGGLIRRWHHLIRVGSLNDSQCVYTDAIEIDAGLVTPLVWVWASMFYRYRHRRWKKLIKLGLPHLPRCDAHGFDSK